MCIVIGKYFPEIGWVAVKNRDRNYIPEISFKKVQENGVETMFFWDDVTQYCEGFNSAGVGVLGASLMVLDDEKEIEKRTKTPSKDGQRIRQALMNASVRSVAASLIKSGLTGNTLVFDRETMILIESAKKDGEFHFRARVIPHDKFVVRTNHGVWLPWAGYQRGEDDNQTMSRISSESRRTIAEIVTAQAGDPEDILDGLTQNYTGNPQLNALRTTTEKKKMRTTSQILIVPKERTMYVRPVQSHMKFNFWELNKEDQQTWVEILSNRALYMNLKKDDLGQDPPFDHSLNHDTE